LTRIGIALGVVLAVSGARPAAGAPAMLGARATCQQAPLEPGQLRVVSIELAGGGQAIGALGFTLRVDPTVLLIRPEDISAGEVAGRDRDVMARAGSSPGTIVVLVGPTVRAPVAPIPDGEVARVPVRVPAAVAGSCSTITLETATFHDTSAGLRLPGSASAGAVATISCAARTGLPGIRCRIATVADLLQSAPADAVKARTRKKLGKLAQRLLTRLDAIDRATPRRTRRLLRTVGTLTRALAKAIDRADRRDRLDPDLAGQLRTETTGASSLLAGVL
jgi:hypothetical protein